MPQRGNEGGARRGQQEQTRRGQAPASRSEENVWDDIMNSSQDGGGESGDSNGFNKINTNFFLTDGETIDVVFLDENPKLFWGHTIKCRTESGKTFYKTEQCQKSEQGDCVLCDAAIAAKSAVGKAKKIVAFRILDSRGSWDKTLNKNTGGFNGEPVPKIFLTPLYLAKTIKTLKDDAGGVITDKVVKLSKNSQYQANFRLEKAKNGGLNYVEAPEYDGELPDIMEVYAAGSDEDLISFLDKFADSAPAPQQRGSADGGQASTNGRRTPGKF